MARPANSGEDGFRTDTEIVIPAMSFISLHAMTNPELRVLRVLPPGAPMFITYYLSREPLPIVSANDNK